MTMYTYMCMYNRRTDSLASRRLTSRRPPAHESRAAASRCWPAASLQLPAARPPTAKFSDRCQPMSTPAAADKGWQRPCGECHLLLDRKNKVKLAMYIYMYKI